LSTSALAWYARIDAVFDDFRAIRASGSVTD